MDWNAELLMHIRNGDADAVERLCLKKSLFSASLSKAKRLNEPYFGVHPIVSAVLTGNPRIVAALLAAGASPNPHLPGGEPSPVEISVENGALPVLELLVAAGADISDTARTPLLKIVPPSGRGHLGSRFHPERLKMLHLLCSAFPETKKIALNEILARVFVDACLNDEPAIVDELAAMGVPVPDGVAVKGLSLSKGLLETLVGAGMDVNRMDSDGQTALLAAVRRSDLTAVSNLLKTGADPSLPDAKGNLPSWLR